MTLRLNGLFKGSLGIKPVVFSLILGKFLIGSIILESESRLNIYLGG